jgi:hypothetical protein
MHDVGVGGDSPIGALDSPRIHRSSLRVSTPEREELSRQLQDGFLAMRDELCRPQQSSPISAPRKRQLRRRVVVDRTI